MSLSFPAGRRFLLVAGVIGLLAAGVAQAQQGSGTNGISVRIETEGFSLNPMNPTLKSVRIDRVSPGLPADKAGVKAGDLVVEVEGIPVAGTKADRLRPHLSKQAGDVSNVMLQRPNGERYRVRLVAVPRRPAAASTPTR